MAKKTPTPRGKARYTRLDTTTDAKFERVVRATGATGSSLIAAIVKDRIDTYLPKGRR